MKLSQPGADLYVPTGEGLESAFQRTTLLGVSAHQDDLEFMAYHAILRGFSVAGEAFGGVVVTNGAGSARDSFYKDYSDAEMVQVRRKEQRKAAFVGDYSFQIQMDHPSSALKDPAAAGPVDDLEAVLRAARPREVYTHNLADKHDTHMSVTLRALAALRSLPKKDRPRRVYGCEVWRDLDWMMDDDKQMLPASARSNIAASLVGVFDSQVTGGKRYDLATAGRRLAHATYYASHGTDQESALNYAMDLTPLVEDPSLDIATYVLGFVDRLRADVEQRVKAWAG